MDDRFFPSSADRRGCDPIDIYDDEFPYLITYSSVASQAFQTCACIDAWHSSVTCGHFLGCRIVSGSIYIYQTQVNLDVAKNRTTPEFKLIVS